MPHTIRCEICNWKPWEGIAPSKGDFPEPLQVCGECAKTLPYADRDGFPVAHFKAESGHWYFVYIHREYLTPYFYPSARPDVRHLKKDVAFREGKERAADEPLCRRVFPYRYDHDHEDEILYFAYGCDVDETLLDRLGVSYRLLGKATAFEMVLDFSKPSGNGPESGLPNLRQGGEEDFVMGHLYLLDGEEEMKKMDGCDEIAGPHVQCRRILVHLPTGQPVPAITYVSTDARHNLKPSPAHFAELTGALRRHGFPGLWLSRLENLDSCSRARESKELAEYAPPVE